MTQRHLLLLFSELLYSKKNALLTSLIVALLTFMQGVGVHSQTLVSEDCTTSIPSDGFEDGVACNLALDQIAANDIMVPADRSLKLNGVSANLIVDEDVTVTSVKVWIFYDEYGYPYMYPGYELTFQDVIPSDMTHLGNRDGKDFYEVSLDLDPIFLQGYENYDTRYWVGLSVETSDESTAYWEVGSSEKISNPTAFSTGSWFDIYDWNLDGTYTFYATCEDMVEMEDCSASIESDGFQDGVSCNIAYDEIAANDIIVPVNRDLLLKSVTANMLVDEGVAITSVKLWVFYDEYGYPYMYPGYEHSSVTMTPTELKSLGNNGMMDLYEMTMELDPVLLSGNDEYDTRYWIGLSVETSDESSAYWEVGSSEKISNPTAYSTGSWFDIYNWDRDGTYTFIAECLPMEEEPGGGDPEPNPGVECHVTNGLDSEVDGVGVEMYYRNTIVANDVVVEKGTDKMLRIIEPRIIMNATTSIDLVQISLYTDEDGLPDELLYRQLAQVFDYEVIDSIGDKVIYDVKVVIDSFLLGGHPEKDMRYWIGLSMDALDGSRIYWHSTTEEQVGYPTAISAGDKYFTVQPERDCVYDLHFTCYEIKDHGVADSGYCDFNDPFVDLDNDTDCFGMVKTGGMFQAFEATQSEISGVAFKFTNPTRGEEVTFSLWDNLPTKDGEMIVSRTSHTYGEQWVNIFWDEPIALEIGKTYFAQVDGSDDVTCVRAGRNSASEGQAYSGFQLFADFDYTFRAFYCNDISCTQRDEGYKSSFENSTLTSKNQENLLATDITIPVGENFNLEVLQVLVWVHPGSQIIDADIVFYEDDNGKPGEAFAAFANVVPTGLKQNNITQGFNTYTTTFDIQGVLLQGQLDNIKTYWVSLDIDTDGGNAYMSIHSSTPMGYESYNSPDNGVTWEKLDGWETAYTFSGTCAPITVIPCESPDLVIDVSGGKECMSSLSGVAQSYTAEFPVSAGAGITLLAPSIATEITISLWDELPISGGQMLASKSVITDGGNDIDVFWDQVVPTEIGETFYILLEGGDVFTCVSGDVSDLYPGGHMYATDFTPFPDWDLNFRVYSCAVEESTVDCTEEVVNDFAFESGANVAVTSNYKTANDITVPAGEDFSLTNIKAAIVSNLPILNADVYYYADNNGVPSEKIGSQYNIPIQSQTLLGDRQGMDVYEVNISVDSFVFEGQLDESTSYWIEISLSDLRHSTEVYWVTTTQDGIGYSTAQKEGDQPWASLSGKDGVYTFEGNCTEIIVVGTVDNKAIDFIYYPNPVGDVLLLKADYEIEKIEIFDILGQKVLYEEINSQEASINTSSLISGSYFMTLMSSEGMSTVKLIKE